jgi:hypothetical protein
VKRRSFITLLGGAAAAWPLTAHAQGEGMKRIGMLMPFAENDPESSRRVAALRHSLQQPVFSASAPLSCLRIRGGRPSVNQNFYPFANGAQS